MRNQLGIAAVIALSACINPGAVGVDTTGIAGSPSGQVPIPGDLAVSQAILELTNSFRAQNGVAPLSLNAKLIASAQSYAEAMATQNFFSHTGLDGSSPGDRMLAAGYDWSAWGENIAYGYTTPEEAMTGWINSPAHRANLLSTSWKELGVGYAVGQYGYWVQDFAAP